MITMEDIIREGHPTLRKIAEEVSFPLSEDEKKIGQEMLEFLKISQDPEKAEELNLRGGVGLAAPQLDHSKRMIAIHIPDEDPEAEPLLSGVLYNPTIISNSVQQLCLGEGEGCLSVDRQVPGYVPRSARITLRYYDEDGNMHKVRLKNYPAIVVQHEIDHLNGVLFFDHIDAEHPFAAGEDVLILE